MQVPPYRSPQSSQTASCAVVFPILGYVGKIIHLNAVVTVLQALGRVHIKMLPLIICTFTNNTNKLSLCFAFIHVACAK